MQWHIRIYKYGTVEIYQPGLGRKNLRIRRLRRLSTSEFHGVARNENILEKVMDALCEICLWAYLFSYVFLRVYTGV